MSDSYLIALPFPPSINGYYGITCNGRIPHKYIKERGKQYRSDVEKIIRDKDLQLMVNVPVAVTITLTAPDNRVHDIDNVLKCLFDALTKAEFWQDDSYIRKLTMDYSDRVEKPGSVLLHITAL